MTRRLALVLAIVAGLLAGHAHAASPTIDGHTPKTFSSASSSTVVLTTASADDIITIACYADVASGAAATMSAPTGGSLTFTSRQTTSDTYTAGACTSTGKGAWNIWEAPSAAAQTATSFTLAYDRSIDDAACVAFGVNGVHSTAAPHDTNGSLSNPAADITNTATAPTVTGTSTSEANDLLIDYLGGCTGGPGTPFTPTSGPAAWTAVDHASNTGGTGFASMFVASQAVSSTQSSLTTAWGNNFQLWRSTVDAFTADAAAAAFSGPVHTVPW